jgi:hypothetical protein
MTKEEAIEKARKDLAQRLNTDASKISQSSVEDADFPDMALGAAEEDEMSGSMMTRGWRIRLSAGGRNYEYRADQKQLRLYNFKGQNYRV